MNLSTRRKAIKARAMVNEGYKMSRIVKEFGVSRQRIWQWLKKINETSPLTQGK